MNRLVLDCSVTMSWCFEDQKTSYSEAVLDFLAKENKGVVPSIWSYEVLNALLGAHRKKRLTQAQVFHFWDVLQSLPIEAARTHNETWALELYSLAQQYHLSSYDASYLELALREGISLATLDDKLKSAALSAGLLWLPPKKLI